MKIFSVMNENRTVQILMKMKSWFDSSELIKNISILGSLDPRDIEIIVGWERYIGHFLSIYSKDKFVLSIQTKKNCHSQYWVYLNIGSVLVQTTDDDLVSTELLLYLVQSINLINQSGKYGSVTMQPTLREGIDIIYCVPIPRWAMMSSFLFGKLINKVNEEVKGKLAEIQKEHEVNFKNNQVIDAEFYTRQQHDEEFDEDDLEDFEPS